MHAPPKDLAQLLDYDPKTGIFIWRVFRGRTAKAGDIAGSISDKGYRRIHVGSRTWMAHHLAWLLTNGELPSRFIDHINGDRLDNRISNLRLATKSQNAGNAGIPRHNTSGLKGVSWSKQMKKWHAQIKEHGRVRHLGFFDNIGDAKSAYEAAAAAHFGPFARFA